MYCGILIEPYRPMQSVNAYLPMVWTVSGIFKIPVNFEQYANWKSSIEVEVCEIFIWPS